VQFESGLVAFGRQYAYMSSLSRMKAIADLNSGFTANPSPMGLIKSPVMPSTTAWFIAACLKPDSASKVRLLMVM
jgi:hypothetical protein